MNESQAKNAGRSSRTYASSVREEQARETRRRVADTAYGLFIAQGYTGTTVATIAASAGVSVQTIYNSFGSKPALLKHVYDVRLAGDDNPVPMRDRPAMRALATETDPAAYLRAYAGVGRTMLERIGPFVAVLVAGAHAGDPELQAHVQTIDSERLVGVRMTVRRLVELGGLRPGLSAERARDAIWTLNSFEVWHLLVGARGWSGRAYEEWVGRAMCDAVLPDPR